VQDAINRELEAQIGLPFLVSSHVTNRSYSITAWLRSIADPKAAGLHGPKIDCQIVYACTGGRRVRCSNNAGLGARVSRKTVPPSIAEQSKAYPAHSKIEQANAAADAKVAETRKERTMILISLKQMDLLLVDTVLASEITAKMTDRTRDAK
jgi:hypothetical protein